MGVYTRFKKSPDGFRALVELLESTPMSRRQKMIQVGMQEDEEYTMRALSFVMSFEDVLGLPDPELAEVVAKVPPRVMAIALNAAGEDTRQRFIRNAKPQIGAEIRDLLSMKVTLTEVGGAQLKVVQTARQLEKAGFVRTKRIPIAG